MTTPYKAASVTDRVIEELEAVALVVGDAEAPAAGGWQGVPWDSDFVGYVVLHPMSVRDVDGTLDDPDVDGFARFQINAFGATRRQCQTMSDLARSAMQLAAFTVDGRTVARVQFDGQVAAAQRIDESQDSLYLAADLYSAFTTPA